MDSTTDFFNVKARLVCDLRRIAASEEGDEIYASERETLAASLGISLKELDARFKEFQRVADAELRSWFLRCWFRSYCTPFQGGATQRAAFPL